MSEEKSESQTALISPAPSPQIQPNQSPHQHNQSPAIQPSQSPAIQPSQSPQIQPSPSPQIQSNQAPQIQPNPSSQIQSSQSSQIQPNQPPSSSQQQVQTVQIQPNHPATPILSPVATKIQPNIPIQIQPNPSCSLQINQPRVQTIQHQPQIQPNQATLQAIQANQATQIVQNQIQIQPNHIQNQPQKLQASIPLQIQSNHAGAIQAFQPTQIQLNGGTLTSAPMQTQQLQPGQPIPGAKVHAGQLQPGTILSSAQIQGQIQHSQLQMQAPPAPSPQAIVPQGAQVQPPQLVQNSMAQVMSQASQAVCSMPGPASMPQQYYVHTSVGSGMQGPPAIAPAPPPGGPQTTTTTTVSALHQPLMHHIAPQPLTHPGVSHSPMPQFSPQVQVIQSGIPGTQYLQQVYQNAQGQFLMPSNLTLQPAPGMNHGAMQQGTISPLNSSIQVIAAGKPFQGQLAPHMLAGGKANVIQPGQATGYNPNQTIPSSVSQTVLISQLGSPLGVISSQPPNILPAHSSNQKPNELPKVNNMSGATFGPIQPGAITWAPGGTLHSPTLLAPQNQPLFNLIRNSQPGQENLYIQQSSPAQHMAPNSMVQTFTSMNQINQQNKPRLGMELQANIQPKTANMRPQPQILPSGPQMRAGHGATIATQTSSGQLIAPANMIGGSPRQMQKCQVQRFMGTKVRGKNASNRANAAAAQMLNQHHQQQQQQQQQQQNIALNHNNNSMINISTAPSPVVANSMPTLDTIQKTLNPAETHTSSIDSSVKPPLLATQVFGTKPKNSQNPPLQNTLNKPISTPSYHHTKAPSYPTSLSKLSNIVSTVSPNLENNSSKDATRPSTPATSQATLASNAQNVAISNENSKQTDNQNGVDGSNCVTWKAIIPPSQNDLPIASVAGPILNGTVTPVQKQSTEAKTLPNGKSGEIEKQTTTTTGPPKAMVKPNVLTHVIDGFVIHEAAEPFPVNRSSILTDMSNTKGKSNTATVLPQSNTELEDRKDDATTQCEFCGKVEQRSKYKKSKRFCSGACAKRHSKTSSLTDEDYSKIENELHKMDQLSIENPNLGGSFNGHNSILKERLMAPSRKSKQRRFNNIESSKLDTANGDCSPPNKRMKEDVEKLEVEPSSDNGQGADPQFSLDDDEDLANCPKVDILKWTVRDVVDFVRHLPGCQDYAEDFELQEIDGQALMLLKADHLMSAMSIKLGPALKICAKIEAMRIDRA